MSMPIPKMKVLLVELQCVASSFLKRKKLLPEEGPKHRTRDYLRGLVLVLLPVGVQTAEAAVAASEKGLVGELH